MSRERRNKKRTVHTEITEDPPKKWKPEEMAKVYECILQYGHKDLQKLVECLPRRSEEAIKSFIRTIYDTAGKYSDKHINLDSWIGHSMVANINEPPWKDSLQVAQIIKALSADGLLENHPLPERCDGIDFRKAYRAIYQCLMGYPVQPVSKETMLFIHDTIAEIINEIKSEPSMFKHVESFLADQLKSKAKDESSADQAEGVRVCKKPIKTYQRKSARGSSNLASQTPSLKIVVEPVDDTNIGLQGYTVTTKGASTKPVILSVPVVPASQSPSLAEDEKLLLKSLTYNPFQIPEAWLQEPVGQKPC